MARTVDTDKAHVAETLRAAAAHEGAALVEIYQNCNVFNDGAFDAVRAKGQREQNQIRLVHGEPIRFGAEGERGVARGADGRLELVDVAEVGEDALLVHDAQRPEPSLAFELAHLAPRARRARPRSACSARVERPVYGARPGARARALERGGRDRAAARAAALGRDLDRQLVEAAAPGRHRSRAELEAGLDDLRASPVGEGVAAADRATSV